MDGWLRKAEKLREAGGWDELLTCCQQWTEERPEEPKSWHHLGMAYVNLNRPEGVHPTVVASMAPRAIDDEGL